MLYRRECMMKVLVKIRNLLSKFFSIGIGERKIIQEHRIGLGYDKFIEVMVAEWTFGPPTIGAYFLDERGRRKETMFETTMPRRVRDLAPLLSQAANQFDQIVSHDPERYPEFN